MPVPPHMAPFDAKERSSKDRNRYTKLQFQRLEPIPAGTERQGTPWTSRLSITGQTHRDRQQLTFPPTDNLASPVNLPDFGLLGESGVPEGTPCKHRENTQTQ